MHLPIVKVIALFLAITLVLVVLPFPMSEGSFTTQNDGRRSGRTIIVNASGGGDYTHIQWAIDNASDGDTVHIRAGVYNESIVIDKTINLIGNNMNDTIIHYDGFLGDNILMNITHDWVNISGFKMIFTLPYRWPYTGIYLKSANNCKISNNNCSNNYFGIKIEQGSNNIIKDNIFNQNEFGIHADSFNNLIISSPLIFLPK